MKYIAVRNFERFQHYSDRTPPWIKFYNAILDDYAFVQLSDAARSHLMLLWLVASRHKNRIPNDPKYIASAIHARGRINLRSLIDAGFVYLTDEPSNAPTPVLHQPESPEATVENASTADSTTLAPVENPATKFGDVEREGEKEESKRENTRALSAPVIEAAEMSVKGAMGERYPTVLRFIETRQPHTHGNWHHELAKLLAGEYVPEDVEVALNDAMTVETPIAGPHALRAFAAKARGERVKSSIPRVQSSGSVSAPVGNDDGERWHELLDVVARLRQRSIPIEEFNALPYALRAGLRSIGGWQIVNEAKAGSLPFLRRDFLIAYRSAVASGEPVAA